MTAGPSRSSGDRSAAEAGGPPRADNGGLPNEAALIRLLDALAVALVFQDHEGQQVIANSEAHRLLGLDRETSSPTRIMEALARMAGAAFARPGPDEFEVQSGGRFFQIRAQVIQGAIGDGLLWRLEDISEERRRRLLFAEAKRRALMADVAGGVGHQFNNLLARLICQAEAIQDAASQDQAHALAEEIICTAEEGARAVRRLMTHAGGVVVDCREVEVAPLVDCWRQGLNGALTIQVERLGGTVVADHDLLRASLDELYANAVQASATALELRCSGEGDSAVVLEVTDDGHGMTPEVCAQATEPFFTRNGAESSVGLGLSMVQGAVRQCGGGLDVVSHPGNGTTVRLILARGKGQA